MGNGPTQTVNQNTSGKDSQFGSNATQANTGVNTTGLNSQQGQGYNINTQQGQNTAFAPTDPVLRQIAGQAGQIAGQAPLNAAEKYAMGGIQGTAQYNTMLTPMFGDAAQKMLDPNSANNAGATNFAFQGGQTPTDNLGGMAAGNLVNFDNPAFAGMLDMLKTDISNSIGSQFAAAGRPLGTNAAGTQALARGFTQGMAPVALDWYNQRTQDQLNANQITSNASFNASGALNNNANTFANNAAQAGNVLNNTYTPYETMLTAQQYGRTAPLQTLTGVNSMIMPMASQFGTTNNVAQGLNINNQEALTQQAVLSQLASLANNQQQSKSKSRGTSVSQTQYDPLTTGLGIATSLLGVA